MEGAVKTEPPVTPSSSAPHRMFPRSNLLSKMALIFWKMSDPPATVDDDEEEPPLDDVEEDEATPTGPTKGRPRSPKKPFESYQPA
jgi:hypothetical protein